MVEDVALIFLLASCYFVTISSSTISPPQSSPPFTTLKGNEERNFVGRNKKAVEGKRREDDHQMIECSKDSEISRFALLHQAQFAGMNPWDRHQMKSCPPSLCHGTSKQKLVNKNLSSSEKITFVRPTFLGGRGFFALLIPILGEFNRSDSIVVVLWDSDGTGYSGWRRERSTGKYFKIGKDEPPKNLWTFLFQPFIDYEGVPNYQRQLRTMDFTHLHIVDGVNGKNSYFTEEKAILNFWKTHRPNAAIQNAVNKLYESLKGYFVIGCHFRATDLKSHLKSDLLIHTALVTASRAKAMGAKVAFLVVSDSWLEIESAQSRLNSSGLVVWPDVPRAIDKPIHRIQLGEFKVYLSSKGPLVDRSPHLLSQDLLVDVFSLARAHVFISQWGHFANGVSLFNQHQPHYSNSHRNNPYQEDFFLRTQDAIVLLHGNSIPFPCHFKEYFQKVIEQLNKTP